MKLNYKTYYDLFKDINLNLYKIPKDVGLIVGVERSGIIPAYMLSSILNIPVQSLSEFLSNKIPKKGNRKYSNLKNKSKVLIVDDSINTGNQLKKLKEELKNKNNIYYFAVYATEQNKNKIDIHCKVCPNPRFFQWNCRHHGIMKDSCLDLDGVLCIDPTDKQNDDGKRYIDFILNATPLFIPHYKISKIVTSRLEKFRKPTEKWLKKNNIEYEELIMLNLPSKKERLRLKAHSPFKAQIYKKSKETLFIESNWEQAKNICKLSGKNVLCTDNGILINYGSSIIKPNTYYYIKNKIFAPKDTLILLLKSIGKILIFKENWREKLKKIKRLFYITANHKSHFGLR